MARCSRCSYNETTDGYRTCAHCRGWRARARDVSTDLHAEWIRFRDEEDARHEAECASSTRIEKAPTPEGAKPLAPVASNVRTYVVVSDVHVPYHDRIACRGVRDLLADLRPDGLVIAGDFLDVLELSRYAQGSAGKIEGRRLAETWREGNALLDEWLRAAGPQCAENHYLDGNHEGRIDDWIQSGGNVVFEGDEALSIPDRLRLEERGIAYHAGEHAQVKLGKLVVTHGRWTNKYHANKHLDEYRHSVLYGHTHSPQTITASAYNAQQVAVGLGHLADPDSSAMSYAPAPNRWCQGFALVHVRPDDSFHVVPLNLWQRRFFYAGRSYGAAA